MEPIKGINRLLFWRLLKEADTNKGRKMMFQTEHEKNYSSDSDEVITKDGPITTSKSVTDEIPFKSIVAMDDDVVKWLETAMIEGETLELWEVDITRESSAGKYPAEYRQGVLTELNYTANAEDLLEVDGTYKTNGKRQTGEVTLSAEEKEVVQYAFRDLEIQVPEV